MIKSDIFIMMPVTGHFKISNDFKNSNIDPEIDLFNHELDKQIKYACKDIVNDSLSRVNLGVFGFKYYENDMYEDGNYIWVNCSISFSYHKNTDLGIIEIILKQFEYEDSQVAAIFHTGRAILKNINTKEELKLYDFIKKIGLDTAGQLRILTQNSSKYMDSDLKYILCGETKNRTHNYFDVDDDFVKNNFNDLLEYDTYYLYASNKAVIQLMDTYSNDFVNNINDEIMPFYLIEFSILQNATLARMNKTIVTKLNSNGKIKIRESLSLIEGFGKTISLWSNNIYNYYFDQKVADGLTKAFETEKLKNEYSNNKSYLEQLTNTKRSISENIANCILGAITFLFTLINLYEIVINFNDYISHPSSLTVSFTLIYVLWVVFLLYRNQTY